MITKPTELESKLAKLLYLDPPDRPKSAAETAKDGRYDKLYAAISNGVVAEAGAETEAAVLTAFREYRTAYRVWMAEVSAEITAKLKAKQLPRS